MTQACRTCTLEKDASEFYKNKNRKSGLHGHCKECCREAARLRDNLRSGTPEYNEYMREWRAKNPDKVRSYRHRREYGLSPEEFDQLSKVCCICGTDQLLGVDHCHDTGQVRDMLCRKCNAAIGFLGDDPDLVRRALDYLLHHEQRIHT